MNQFNLDSEPDEGVVKYTNLHEDTPLPHSLCPNEEFYKIRSKLFEKNLIGLTPEGIGYGNLSIALPEEQFIISGTQTGHLKHLNPENLSLVTHWDLISNCVWSCGETPPSSEAITHGTIYECFEGACAVIHIHNQKYWQYALSNYPKVVSPYGTVALAQEIQDKRFEISNYGIFAMEGHKDGVFVFGTDIQTCFKILLDKSPN